MLHIVDDEIDIQCALTWVAKSRDIDCTAYSSGEELLAALNIPLTMDEDKILPSSMVNFDPNGDCIILDIRMGGISGIATFNLIAHNNLCKRLPVIFMTGHGEVGLAVEAMKRGALDFFEKPFDDSLLFDQVAVGLKQSRKAGEMAGVYQRFDKLTMRERQILDLILTGKMNKVIADKLGISMRTVEVHRANILDKMEVKTAIELVGFIK
jgi:two-component system response regulator DctR